MENLIKILKDSNYEYRWSVDGNKYGEAYDITSMGGFGDTKLVNEGWEEVLAVNGSLFYPYEGAHYAEGLEKSRGVNNQDVCMSAVTDFNNAMSVGCGYDGQLVFDKQINIINNLNSYYGAITGMGIIKDGQKVEWGKGIYKEWNYISGRTVIGSDSKGNFLSYSFAGETGKSGKTVDQLYDILINLGFYNAIVFDGGGSVWRRHFGKYDITTSRLVKNALILYRKKKSTPEPVCKVDFFPRLSKEGMVDNKYWYDKDYNVGADGALRLPNCTTYACGRFGELNNQNMRNMMKERSGFGDAKEWYEATKYDKGSKPKVGSIACFGGDYGHVAIVERINEDGTITVSQSNYEKYKSYSSENYFQTRTYTLVVGKVPKGVGLVFLGYIYPPNLKEPVVRDTTKYQVKVLADVLKIRDNDGNWIEGRFAQKNEIYNVLDVKGTDELNEWAEIAEGVWIKLNDKDGWTETYKPVQPEPVDDKDKKIKELEAKVASLIKTIEVLEADIKNLDAALDKVSKEKDKLAKYYDELLQKNVNYGERLTEIHCISDTSKNFNI